VREHRLVQGLEILAPEEVNLLLTRAGVGKGNPHPLYKPGFDGCPFVNPAGHEPLG